MQLLDVAHTLPEARIAPLGELRVRYGMSDRTYRIFDRLFGLEGSALHPDTALPETLRASALKLAARNPDLWGRVAVLVYCHALNTALPFDAPILADLAQDTFGCRPEVLSVTHGSCASALMALDLLRADATALDGEVVVLTGEKCSFELLDYADNNGLFGEVASAARLRGGPGLAPGGAQVAGIATGRFDGVYAPMPKAGAEALAAYGAAFLPRLTEAAERAMAQAGIGPDAIDVVLPTHLSPFTFDKVATRLGVPTTRVRKDNLARMGHCFCGDLFVNYDTWRRAAPPSGAGATRILSFAAGMTGSYAAIILKTEGRPS